MTKKSKPIDSMQHLQKRLPVILDALRRDQRLFAGALANPLLAIEEVGYKVSKDFRRELELYLRFSEDTRQMLAERSKDVFEAVGEQFDISDPAQLERVLFQKLELTPPDVDEPADDSALPSDCRKPLSPPAPSVFGRQFDDPLASLAEAHPVMKPLLEYRRLESSEPRFASPSLYRRIREGDVDLPVRRIRFRLGHDDEG